MKVRALKGFSGTLSMHEGEVRELESTATLDELIRIGYLEVITEKADEQKAEEQPGEVAANENKRGKPKRN